MLMLRAVYEDFGLSAKHENRPYNLCCTEIKKNLNEAISYSIYYHIIVLLFYLL